MEKEEVKEEQVKTIAYGNRPAFPIEEAIAAYLRIGKGAALPEVLGLSKREYAAIHCLACSFTVMSDFTPKNILKNVDELLSELESSQKRG